VLTTDRRDHKPHRYERIEAFALLTNDDLDLALTYDYNLAPASPGPVLETVALWSVPWGLGVPADTPDGPADYADRTWIVNSRNTPTTMRCAPWHRWPVPPRASPTRSTASHAASARSTRADAPPRPG
jgi:hypothetical protein